MHTQIRWCNRSANAQRSRRPSTCRWCLHPLVGGLTVGLPDPDSWDGVAFGEVTSRVVAFLGENHVIQVFGQTGALDLRLCPIRELLADAKLAVKVATVDGLDDDATNCGLVDC